MIILETKIIIETMIIMETMIIIKTMIIMETKINFENVQPIMKLLQGCMLVDGLSVY